jgi:M6 family metalloprotease-like protein
VHFDVTLRDVRPPVTLRVSHPRAGAVTLGVVSPEKETVAIRREFAVEEGYLTPDRVTPLAGEWFEDGRPKEERWARFDPPSERDEVRVAVLLGEWADRRHTVPALAFARAFFSEGGAHRRSATGQPAYGSLADFYREMSHGRVTVTGRVFDWAELPGPWKAARDASFGSRDLSRALIAAIRERDGEDALDGFDAVAVVWAGNAVARTSMLWPMRIAVDGRPDLVAFKMSELFRGEMAPIGVPAHELGHTFGVNDKYGLGAPENPFGPFCLIGKGTHGGTPSGRHRPFHFCAWCKSVLGWTDPVAIDPKREHRLALRPITFDARECFRIPLTPDGSDSLLLENRRREGFHTDLPAEGLYVIRVRPHTRPSAPQRQVELLPAHGLPRAARSDPASPDAVAWPQPGRTELLVDGVRIGDIRLVDGVVHFTVGPAD